MFQERDVDMNCPLQRSQANCKKGLQKLEDQRDSNPHRSEHLPSLLLLFFSLSLTIMWFNLRELIEGCIFVNALIYRPFFLPLTSNCNIT